MASFQNGTVTVWSQKGKGSKFTIKLPLTLAIIQGLLVKVGREIYSIPITSVIESHRIKPEDIKMIRALGGREWIADLERKAGPSVTDVNQAIPRDRVRTRYAIEMIRQRSTRFLTVHLAALDHLVVDEEMIDRYLYTRDLPDPDLVIRTSGEMRLSNFLLWQLAYAEIYVTDTLWPDFREPQFLEALEHYQQRERRFGRVTERADRERLRAAR